MVKNSRYRGIFASILAILLVVAVISSCNNLVGFGIGDSSPNGPIATGILTPTNNAKILVGSPVQVLSAPPSGDTDQVELRVKATDQETEQLISRVNLSSNGTALQQWTPSRAGLFTIMVVTYNNNGDIVETLPSIQVEVIDSAAVSIAPVRREPAVTQQPSDQGAAFQGPTETPSISTEPTEIIVTSTPEVAPQQAAEFRIQVVAAEPVTMGPTPTAVPRYPPPPPIPGVPYGPTQDQLPELIPPVCDAAKLVGVFTSDNTQRVLIAEDDDKPARATAGTTVFRAWRVQNIGLCTWGPGYELAFYGGRAMGSGGVAFESTFPGEPARRNTLLESNRLIVPQGKPNQTSVLEVQLNVPTFPGIHQSYWRMRNPQGVFFGPIMGVTLEVLRDCQFNVPGARTIYGAPTINQFRVLGIEGAYEPLPIPPSVITPTTTATPTPPEFLAISGNTITVDYDIINADNFDLIIEDPTGELQTVSTADPRGRITFQVTEVGDWSIRLFADNGSCTPPPHEVIIRVNPPQDQQFRLIIIHSGASSATSSAADASLRSSPAIQAGDIRAEWNHFDKATNDFVLFADLYERKDSKSCYNLFGFDLCLPSRGDWKQVDRIQLDVGGEGDAQGAASVTNIERGLCNSVTDLEGEYQFRYVLQAKKDGWPADPQFSNVVIDSRRPCNVEGPSTEIKP